LDSEAAECAVLVQDVFCLAGAVGEIGCSPREMARV
jgi:hypothetical protein